MFKITSTSCFSAAHHLRGYRGKCEELHGHNWKVEVSLSSKSLDKIGMIADFKDIKAILKRVLEKLDHKDLNNISYFKKVNPTSENIARYIFDEIKDKLKIKGCLLDKIRVWESENASATYEE